MTTLTTVAQLEESIEGERPPAGASLMIEALWWARKGDWHKAHGLAQDQGDADGSWVHAYLHRVEGDLSNAGYWYRRAGRPVASGSLDQEWQAIAQDLISRQG